MNERSIQEQSIIDARHTIELLPESHHKNMVLQYLDTSGLWLAKLFELGLNGPTAPSVQE